MLFLRLRKKRKPKKDAHYEAWKEIARSVIAERTRFWNEHYGFTYQRIAIRNQKRRWGSCSARGNINFNYRLIFLPEGLMDYVIVHELCHLGELNHGSGFWNLVAKGLPDYELRRTHLKRITYVPKQGFPSSLVARSYTSSL